MYLLKIQRTNDGSFFVCLPKHWTKRNGLNRELVVSIIEIADRPLIVDPKYNVKRAPQVAVVTLSSLLDRVIVEKYLLSYKIIQVQAKDRISTLNRDRVEKASSHLVGLKIVEENHYKIFMKYLLEQSTFPPEKILRREYSIVLGIRYDAIAALLEGDFQLAKNVVARDNEVNRLYFLLVLILRTAIQNLGLTKKLGILSIECLDYRLVASFVLSIDDPSSPIGEIAIKLDDI